MPAYSFQQRFVPLIEDGSKKQTIRKKRKYLVIPGDTLYLYYGLRTKYCKKLKEVICKKVQDIRIFKNGMLKINGIKILDEDAKICIAYADGFRWKIINGTCYSPWDMMLRWWKETHELPFKGDVIYW